MKVVIFCGGLGTRLREHSDTIPKPLVNIGYRPIIWHLMRYYSHFGHRDFVLCLGYRGDLIREYFLRYSECMSNDFTLDMDSNGVELHTRDTGNWRITFVDTGLHSNIGQRLLRAKKYVESEPMFLANYSDGLSDLPLNDMIADFDKKGTVASFVAVPSWHSFHTVHADPNGYVSGLGRVRDSEFLVNGGYFAIRPQIFDFIEEGDELVEQPFAKLAERRLLSTFRYRGFWQQMDTFKDKITLDRMEAQGDCPWMLWKSRLR